MGNVDQCYQESGGYLPVVQSVSHALFSCLCMQLGLHPEYQPTPRLGGYIRWSRNRFPRALLLEELALKNLNFLSESGSPFCLSAPSKAGVFIVYMVIKFPVQIPHHLL